MRSWTKTGCLLLGLAACAPAAPPIAPTAYEGQPPLNPRLPDGRIVYRTFGDHHPECFAFVAESRETETVACPGEALHRLAGCPGGRLYESRDAEGCVCVPEDGEPSRTPCP